jgi:hypothetical protein
MTLSEKRGLSQVVPIALYVNNAEARNKFWKV